MTSAALAAAGAVWLLFPAGSAGRRTPGPRRPWAFGVAFLVAGLLVLGADRSMLVLGAIGLGVAAGAHRLWRRRRLATVSIGNRARVVELCDALRVELGAGQAPADALALAAGDWEEVAPAARTARTGGDVPAVLRDLAAMPGAHDLRVVAAAWQVAHRTGHGLADALGRIATDLRAAEQTRRVVAGELASARATARLVAALPVAALVLGTGAGSDPWAFLLHQPLGWGCLTAGLGFGWAGLTWIEALAADVERVG